MSIFTFLTLLKRFVEPQTKVLISKSMGILTVIEAWIEKARNASV